MNISPRYLWRGAAVGASLAVVAVLLFASPSGTAEAVASSNNLQTTVSLDTNAATGSDTFTTLPPITLTCNVVDVTAGVANGVSGITLALSAGWTFAGGTPPSISYAAWPAPDGQATGTIASAGIITDDITTSCSPGSVVTFTGVQVKPLTATSGDATIIADINTADVTVARITAQAATATPTATATATPTATASPTATATASPTSTPTTSPTTSPTVAPTSSPSPAPSPAAPQPADTGTGGLLEGGSSLAVTAVLAAATAALVAVTRRFGVRR